MLFAFVSKTSIYAALVFSLLWGSTYSAHAAEITANEVLKRGTVLTRADISITLSAGENLQDIYAAYIGQQLMRTVYAGHNIETRYIGAPILVKRNAQVNMIYRFGAMELSAQGRALQAGAKGETISVMNVSSRKKILAVVLENNVVEVGQ